MWYYESLCLTPIPSTPWQSLYLQKDKSFKKSILENCVGTKVKPLSMLFLI